MPHSIRPGEILAGRYRLIDLLTESEGGRFWRARDKVLERPVAIHVIDEEDARAPGLLESARQSATVLDRRILRVLDAETRDGLCYVVNEWGSGISLDILVNGSGPLGPRRSAWLVSEVADSIAQAHAAGVAHGRLAPENVLIDKAGEVRIIGFCVEAALHGLPPGRQQVDVVDLAGLLYCSLTAKWAGASSSQVPAAPTHHGRVLRPRRVRAGVPRSLDELCDQVLHDDGREPDSAHTARGIAAYLTEVVGDPTGIQQALVASLPKLRPDELIVLPQVPEIQVRDTSDLIPQVTPPEPDPEPEPDAEPEPAPEPEAKVEPAATGPAPEDLPTEAGVPIFDEDGDEVEWFQARSTPPPPPPPFEEPPERPLFAPEPADGRPARRSRVPTPAPPPHGPEYWPWETSNGRGTDTGLQAVDDDEVPGRSWFRLALGIAAGLLLLLAVVVAFNLGRGKTVLGADPGGDDEPSQRPQQTASAQPLPGLTATDFDPQGDPPEENSEDAPLVVDRQLDTAWTTSSYNDQLGPGGLKTGVGLVIDLQGSHEVERVDIAFGGEPHGVDLYLTDEPPTGVAGLTRVAGVQAAADKVSIPLERPTTGRYLIVWLTSLPRSDGGFRGSVAEVVVRGD